MKHVLIVDADKKLRDTSVVALESAGFTVAAAAGAQAAIGLCEAQMPAVVLLELQLQRHSGVEFLHEFRSYPEWQEVPVILYTVVPVAQLVQFDQAFKTLGIIAHAYKPETSLKQLISLIEDVLKKTK